jgi:hypothetical protein
MVKFHNSKTGFSSRSFLLVLGIASLVFIYFGFLNNIGISYERGTETIKLEKEVKVSVLPPLDREDYDKRINQLANIPPPVVVAPKIDPKTGQSVVPTEKLVPKPNLWPVKTVYPNSGAILPFNRIIAYYGNLYSKKMGVLGEYPKDEMFSRLNAEVKKWNEADPGTPALPALHYIAVTAQLAPGEDGKYRLRMPGSEIDKVLKMAEEISALVFLDIQVGFSTLQSELPLFEKYFKLPNVHLGIDAEFSMKGSIRPGKAVGTFDAEDINYAINYLSKIVKDNNLTPKILVVHRYTQKMITNYQNIKPTPEVQVVMHMDGWGGKAKKINTYKQFVYTEPVQFTGFKIFYKNDVLDEGTTLMTPNDLLKLSPQPIYIQYQ